jgi:hypothetical protein
MKLSKEQYFGILRHGLTFIGAVMIARGQFSESQWYEISGAAVSLAATLWSIVAKAKTIE